MPEEKPKEPRIVNDFFWLNRGAEITEGSATRIDEGAQRLATALAWFWTVYSAAATIVITQIGPDLSVGQTILVIAPIAFLFIAYFFATWASLPVQVSFQVIDPVSIKRAHESSVNTKRCFLTISTTLSGIAVALILWSLICLSLMQTPTREILIDAFRNNNATDIRIEGYAAAGGNIAVTVIPAKGDSILRLFHSESAKPFHFSVPAPPADSYDVILNFKESKRTITVRETVKP